MYNIYACVCVYTHTHTHNYVNRKSISVTKSKTYTERGIKLSANNMRFISHNKYWTTDEGKSWSQLGKQQNKTNCN